MTESKHAKAYNLVFIDTAEPSSVRHPADECLWNCLQVVFDFGECTGHETQRRISQERHGHTDKHENRGWKINPCLCNHASKDSRLFYHVDDFVIIADEK